MNPLLSINLSSDFIHTIQTSEENIFTLTQDRYLSHYQLKNDNIEQKLKRKFEHSLYDVKAIKDIHIVSCKDMPIRIFQTNSDKNSMNNCIASISDHKPNTQAFISPIRMTIKQNILTGGGRKVLRTYDLNKYTKSKQFKQFDKIMVSEIEESNDQNVLIVGDFSGYLYLVDKVSLNTIAELKGIHQGGIMDIKAHPTQQTYFVSSARKDNFKYLWDARNLSTFVQSYYCQSSTNQRVNILVEENKLIVGTQTGETEVFDLSSGEVIGKNKIGNKSINCINRIQNLLIISEGQRQFQQLKQESKMIIIKQQ